MTRAREIAEGLTKAQRRAMLRNYRDGEPTALRSGDPSIATLKCLGRLGLVDGPDYSRNRLWTPLGLEVRAILQEKDHG